MDYLFVDTNIYIYCSLGSRGEHEPGLLEAICKVLDHDDARLVVPETVRREYENKMRRTVDDHDRNVENALKDVKKALIAQTDRDRVAETMDEIRKQRKVTADKARVTFDELMGHDKTLPLDLDGDTVARALGYSISGQSPSKGKTARERSDGTASEPGFVIEPDCLIVASLANYLESLDLTTADRLIVCSHNLEDFADFDEESKQHVLASTISAEIPCETVYYSSLDSLLEVEFTGVKLSEADKAEYADAKEQAQRLAQAQTTHSRLDVECPGCGLPIQTSLAEAAHSTRGIECQDCGRQFGLLRNSDGSVRLLDTQREERILHSTCPDCSHSMRVRVFSDMDGTVERWCLKCFHRLTIDVADGAVTESVLSEPVEATVAGMDQGKRLLRCPECPRIIRSFVRTTDGDCYAICNNEDHGPLLLVSHEDVET